MRLSLGTLAGLPKSVARPAYDPRQLRTGIVHLGIGAFHRAHQALYTDQAADLVGSGWGIVGVTQRSRRVIDQLEPQDGLYTVEVRGGDGDRVVGAVRAVVPADHAAGHIAAPGTRIVSSTVTEKGYAADLVRRRLDRTDPAVAADLADPQPRRSVVGQLIAGFAARADAGTDGLTVLCCDNISRGGSLLRDLCTEFVHDWRSGAAGLTAQWLDEQVSFPDTLVDRIVPATTEADRADLQRRAGYRDEGLVVTEPFGRWIIEDRFVAGHPAWPSEVRLVDDVGPWSAAKLRLLNGAHSVLAYTGLLRGVETVAEAMAVPDLAGLADRWLAEAAQSLGDLPEDIQAYRAAVPDRLRNPAIAHRLAQIAQDGSLKLPPRVLATAAALAGSGHDAPAAALGLAAWLRYLQVTGRPDDPLAARLVDAVSVSAPRAAVDAVLGPAGVVPAADVLQGGFLDDVAAALAGLR